MADADGKTKAEQKVGEDSEPSTQRLLKELRVIHESSNRLHRLRNAEELAHDVIAILQDVIHYDFAAVYLIDGQTLKTFAVNDRGLGESVLISDKAYLESLQLRVGENITGWVAQHGESVVIANTEEDVRYLDSRSGVRSELCVPMRTHEGVMGVINLESTRLAAYDSRDQHVLEVIASQIAIAIQNSRMLARTQEFARLKILNELTGGIAHDLGNVLQIVTSYYDLIVEKMPPGLINSKDIKRVDLAFEKAIELTRGLLNIGRPQPGQDTVIDLGEVLHAATPLLNVLVGPSLVVRVQTAPARCVVSATVSQIEQILMNLVINSRQAMPNGGEITISTMLLAQDQAGVGTKGNVRMRVRDTGIGMDAEVLERALEPYFTTRAEGTGLGLSTVARLVSDLGGRLDIDSEPDRGTTFNILLPLVPPASATAV